MSASQHLPSRGRALLVLFLVLLAVYFISDIPALRNPMVDWGIYELLLGIVAVFTVLGCLLMSAVESVTQGVRCPECRDVRMGRARIISFGPRIYRCPKCATAWFRPLLGDWLALDPRALPPAERPGVARGPIEEAPWKDDADGLGAPSIDSLLRSHRERKEPG